MPDFSKLTRYNSRQFVPEDFSPADWPQAETLYDKLIERNLATVPALEGYLRDWSELSDAVDEVARRRYVAMTCQTDDTAAAEAYRYMITEIIPRQKPRENELEKHFLAAPSRQQLPPQRYTVFDRQIARRDSLFREANVPLETDEALAVQEYQKVRGAMTVLFDGEERTLAQLSLVLEEPDRSRREAAFRAGAERLYQDRNRMDDLFDKLRDLRVQIAANADFANYRDYAFANMLRFDYSPVDCFTFHEAVEAHVVPLLQKIQARRRAQMSVDPLRPWDLLADPLGRPPLRPFASARELVDGCARIFERVDPALAVQFRQLDTLSLLDLENRKGKAPGGYQEFLAESRLPFIFMNAVGSEDDVDTLLHEGGHAFNSYATRSEWLGPYRQPPLEFAEVASMGMELLGADYLEEFYTPADAHRSRTRHLQTIVRLLAWIATVDVFQHWLYTHPQHARAERDAEWASIFRRFAGDVDWSGLEEFQRKYWHRQLHIFEVPFYFVEYGIAQLGALQVWRNMRRDRPAAVAAYRRALALGGSRPLPEIYAAADIQFRFDAGTVAPLMEMVAEALAL